MKPLRPVCMCLGLLAGMFCGHESAHASFIVDFETVPGGSPSEGLAINTQYAASTGMSFSLLGGGSPILAEVGAPRTAFQGPGVGDDNMAPGQGTGSFFLTTASALTQTIPATLAVSYAAPVAIAGGYILDLDGSEAWRVDAFDSANNLLDSISLTTASPNAGDGLATGWSFSRAVDDISSVQIVYTGGLQMAVGFAWDNFSTTHVPLPSSLALLLTGGLSLLAPAWRRRRVTG